MKFWYKKGTQLIPLSTDALPMSATVLPDGDGFKVQCTVLDNAVLNEKTGFETTAAANIYAESWIGVMAAKLEQSGGGVTIIVIDDSDF